MDVRLRHQRSASHGSRRGSTAEAAVEFFVRLKNLAIKFTVFGVRLDLYFNTSLQGKAALELRAGKAYAQSEMKRLIVLFCAFLTGSVLRAEGLCVPSQSAVIEEEARCVDDGGISIGIGEEEGAKVACMASKVVQNRCGPDGSLTRLRAYTTWFNKLKDFETVCAAKGGTFSYQDPAFVEPQDESYCLQAVPEVGSSMFEEPLCNFRSLCPAVTVVCDRPCPERSVARLY